MSVHHCYSTNSFIIITMNDTDNKAFTGNSSDILQNVTLHQSRPLLKVIGILFGTTTILFNLPSICIVVVAFLRKKKLKQINVLCLSITDAFLGVSWLICIDILNGTEMTFINCFVKFYLVCTSFIASNFQVLGIFIERSLVVCLNVIAIKKRKNISAICTVVGAWGMSILMICLIATLNSIPHENPAVCTADQQLQENFERAHAIFGIFFGSIQFGVLGNMIILLSFLVKHSKRMQNAKGQLINKADIRLCSIISVIGTIYLVANTPMTVVFLLQGFYKSNYLSRNLRNATFMFAGMNSMINPFVYQFRIKDFRVLLKESICYLCPCKNKVKPRVITVVVIDNDH